jgi:hypothetical protein
MYIQGKYSAVLREVLARRIRMSSQNKETQRFKEHKIQVSLYMQCHFFTLLVPVTSVFIT